MFYFCREDEKAFPLILKNLKSVLFFILHKSKRKGGVFLPSAIIFLRSKNIRLPDPAFAGRQVFGKNHFAKQNNILFVNLT
jgi:hypothetical protein